MLKYHNFDKDEPIELFFNSEKLNIDDVLGREFVTNMRSTYFHLFDLISMTDFDDIKKRLMKNKIKAITVDLFGKLVHNYSNGMSESVFTNALSVDGDVVKAMDEFSSFVFSDVSSNREYFFKESIRIFSDSILSLSILKPKE